MTALTLDPYMFLFCFFCKEVLFANGQQFSVVCMLYPVFVNSCCCSLPYFHFIKAKMLFCSFDFFVHVDDR